MKFKLVSLCLLAGLCAASVGAWVNVRARGMRSISSSRNRPDWDAAAASRYLESREVWWQKWPSAQRDRGTVCISCHTVLPYALVQPALRLDLGEMEMSTPEKAMLASIEKRVTEWNEMTPYYTDAADGPGMTEDSRATESVLNAVILTSYDTADGHLRPITRKALDEAWALQETTGESAGGWKWQNFNLAPWESTESGYQGATLLAVALGRAPDNYAADAANRARIARLQEYLRRRYASQPVMNQVYLLWASARMPELMNASERSELIGRVESLQRPDGGFALADLDPPQNLRPILRDEWQRLSGDIQSDGCATGLVVLALEQAGTNPSDRSAKRGLEWLAQHQQKDGSWWATSLNGTRNPDSDIGRFMSDAATGYAALALEIAREGTAQLHGAQTASGTQISLKSRPERLRQQP